MNLIKIKFDDGAELAVECDYVKVSKKGVWIVGGNLNNTFRDDAHGAELITMNTKSVDYAKVERINDAIKRILSRIDKIDELLNENRYSPFLQAEESRKGLLEERKQLFETYQKDLKELEKCYVEEAE